MKDLNAREFIILFVLAVGVLALGIWPQPLTRIMEASLHHLVDQAVASKLPVPCARLTYTCRNPISNSLISLWPCRRSISR